MRTQRFIGRVLAVVIIFLLSGAGLVHAQSGSVLVAAASSMKFAFDDLIPAFHKKYPDIKMRISFGSSGNFYSQIVNGAPYDVYFSADMDYPRRLESGKWAGRGQKVTPYAVGKIALWSSRSSGIDVRRKKMDALLSSRALRIAIANPAHAPYGRAAVEALKYFKVFASVERRLVMGENVTQAAQFAHTGAAQVGIIALSLARIGKMKSAGTYWEIPSAAYRPIEQGYLILKNAENPVAVKAFTDFVSGADGAEILKRYGFGLPGDER